MGNISCVSTDIQPPKSDKKNKKGSWMSPIAIAIIIIWITVIVAFIMAFQNKPPTSGTRGAY